MSNIRIPTSFGLRVVRPLLAELEADAAAFAVTALAQTFYLTERDGFSFARRVHRGRYALPLPEGNRWLMLEYEEETTGRLRRTAAAVVLEATETGLRVAHAYGLVWTDEGLLIHEGQYQPAVELFMAELHGYEPKREPADAKTKARALEVAQKVAAKVFSRQEVS